MLSPSQQHSYQAFQQAIEQLLSTATAINLDLTTIGVEFQEVKKLFQSQIVNLIPGENTSDLVSQWRSLQTEIYKQMRLLETDMMMLRVARSPATLQHRLAGMSDHLNALRQYCQVLLQERE